MSQTHDRPTEPLWTYERYAALEDGVRYQVFSGMLVEEPAPTTWHQSVIQLLYLRLAPHIQTIGGRLFLAPVDVVLDAGAAEIEVLQPDLLWVRRERAPLLVETRRISGPPDLVIEVLSPSHRRRDIIEKTGRYQRFDIPSIWLIDPPRQRVEELLKTSDTGDYSSKTFSGDDIFHPQAFPDWRLELRDLWDATR